METQGIIEQGQQVEGTPQAPDFNAVFQEQVGLPLEDVRARISEYDVLKGRVEQFEAQSQIKPYANDFVEKLNDLFKSGATPDHVLRFTQVQNMDVSKMSPEQAIKTQYQLQNPTLSAEDVDFLVESELGELPNEEEDPEGFLKAKKLRDIKAKMKSEDAKKFLESQKTDLSQIKSPETEQRRALETGWSQVLGQVVKDTPIIDLKVDLENGAYYTLPEGFKPKLSKEQSEAIRNSVLNNLVSQGVQLNEQGLQMAKQLYDSSVRIVTQDQILRAIIEDMAASVEQQVIARLNTNK